MSDITAYSLLNTPTAVVRDVRCRGTCRHRSAEECASSTHLVFPYRGTYVRHLDRDDAVAEASQVLFYNPSEGYSVSHPIRGGDACLDIVVDSEVLHQLAPKALLREKADLAFLKQRLAIEPRTQTQVALLRHNLHKGVAEPLEAESRVLAIVSQVFGPRVRRRAEPSMGKQKLVDRVKLALATDLSRRWTLSEIAEKVGGSPVYLTQIFQQVEGVPLYRYQLGLRLARALDLLGQYDDLAALSFELGFSSHSHFSAAFLRTYGQAPSEFRQLALGRKSLNNVTADSPLRMA
jgi:AraC family transcriptional regulator